MDLHQFIIAATEAVQHATEIAAPISDAAQNAGQAVHATEESTGVLGTLGINWKLLLAQLVNFSLVLFIFWKWIVKPLAKTLTQRQEKIESGLKNADYMEHEKKNFEIWKHLEMGKARTEAEKIIKSATDTANIMKQDIILEANNQSKKMVEQAKSQINSEKTEMMKEVRHEVADLVVMASEKILRQKLDNKKDQELISESVRNIQE